MQRVRPASSCFCHFVLCARVEKLAADMCRMHRLAIRHQRRRMADASARIARKPSDPRPAVPQPRWSPGLAPFGGHWYPLSTDSGMGSSGVAGAPARQRQEWYVSARFEARAGRASVSYICAYHTRTQLSSLKVCSTRQAMARCMTSYVSTVSSSPRHDLATTSDRLQLRCRLRRLTLHGIGQQSRRRGIKRALSEAT